MSKKKTGIDEKHQITIMFGVITVGDFLPMQMIYQDKDLSTQDTEQDSDQFGALFWIYTGKTQMGCELVPAETSSKLVSG